MGVTLQTRQKTYDLAGGKCENPTCLKSHDFNSTAWEWHHIFFKSQYRKEDRNESWNGAMLCGDGCHRGGGKSVHGGNTVLDLYLKAKAKKNKPKKEPTGIDKSLIKKRIESKKIYNKKMNTFKKANGGLSPSQIAYRRQKEWRKKNEL